jgi:predicted nucleotidyltransferase
MARIRKKAGLASALFSQVQLRVLTLIIGHPTHKYRLTEIIRIVGSGRGAVQRELERLTRAGIIDLSVSENGKLYQANRESPIFDELHGLIIKTVGLVDPLQGALKLFSAKIKVAFIYGSIARGSDTAKSDIDIMIIGYNISYSEIYNAVHKVEKTLRRQINPNIMSATEWQQKLSDKNSFIMSLALLPKLFIIGTEDDLKRISEPRKDRASQI